MNRNYILYEGITFIPGLFADEERKPIGRIMRGITIFNNDLLYGGYGSNPLFSKVLQELNTIN
jgi:hypothetical protein